MALIPIPNSPQPPKRIPPNANYRAPSTKRNGSTPRRSMRSMGRSLSLGGLWMHIARKLMRAFKGGKASGGQVWRNHGLKGSGQGGRTGFAGMKKRLW